MTKYFGVFCKNCGSYEIDIFTDSDDDIIFECDQCGEKEILD